MSSGFSSSGNLTEIFPRDSHNVNGLDEVPASLRENREQDRRKGIAISHQMTIWNALLDARIQLQKAVSATNNLPSSRSTGVDPTDVVQSVVQEASGLSRELHILQSNLYKADGLDVEIRFDPSNTEDTGESISSWSSTISDIESVYHPHLTRTLSKWSAKVQLVTPDATLGFISSKSSQRTGVVDAIDDLLAAESEQLLAHTRLMSSKDSGEVLNSNTFNDSDFYQQLLRDIIEYNASGSGSHEQPWLQRQVKARHGRKVDTKASKGRKLRYEVHERIQHFMIPISSITGVWPDEQIDELFSSLVDT